MELTAEYIKSRLSYNPETGDLTWIPLSGNDSETKRWNTSLANKVAGKRAFNPNGKKTSIYVTLLGKPRIAHRLIWAIVHGEFPDGYFIDHINGDPFDNRISNLRLCSNAENQHNRKYSSKSKSLVKGVSFASQQRKWKVTTRANGNYYHGGFYATKGEAAVAAAKDSLKYHGKFSPYYKIGRDFEPNQVVRTERQMSLNNPIQLDN